MRWFRVAAAVEFTTLVILLLNLATVHVPAVATLGGPVHGCAYLVVVVATMRDSTAATATKALAWLPGIGGLLVLRRRHRATASTLG